MVACDDSIHEDLKLNIRMPKKVSRYRLIKTVKVFSVKRGIYLRYYYGINTTLMCIPIWLYLVVKEY